MLLFELVDSKEQIVNILKKFYNNKKDVFNFTVYRNTLKGQCHKNHFTKQNKEMLDSHNDLLGKILK